VSNIFPTRLPCVGNVRDGLEGYRRRDLTDNLTDKVVYCLYELTTKTEIVEGAVGD